MSSKALDNLVTIGTLKEEAGNQREFDSLLDLGRKRLTDAGNDDLSPESRFDLAYSAAHSFALAAMRWHGYRPNNKRYAVFQALEHTLEVKPEVWRVLGKCHQIRNSVEYEGYFHVDDQLLADLLKTARLVGEAVKKLGPIK